MSNKSWTAEPTSIVWIDEKTPVPVNSLPDDIRFEIETYDKIRQEFLDIRFKLEVLQLAVSGKYNQIVVKVKNAIEANKPKQTTESHGEQINEVVQK